MLCTPTIIKRKLIKKEIVTNYGDYPRGNSTKRSWQPMKPTILKAGELQKLSENDDIQEP